MSIANTIIRKIGLSGRNGQDHFAERVGKLAGRKSGKGGALTGFPVAVFRPGTHRRRTLFAT